MVTRKEIILPTCDFRDPLKITLRLVHIVPFFQLFQTNETEFIALHRTTDS